MGRRPGEPRDLRAQARIPGADVGDQPMPVCFALVAPRAGAQTDLFCLLQTVIVAPLVERQLLREFRVLSATPPSFVAESSTLLVFELVVPCPWPVTDWDVYQWQRRLGSEVRLVVMPAKPRPVGEPQWDAAIAKTVLERVMALGPVRKPDKSKTAAPWLAVCSQRGSSLDDCEKIPPISEGTPVLSVIDEAGRQVKLRSQMTLMTPEIARELCQHLPVSYRWRTVWRLAYSPRVHGVSLQTFFRRLRGEGPSLLLVQDHNGHTFGGYASAMWHVSERYFGDGDTFVFRFERRLPKPVISVARQMQILSGEESSIASQGGEVDLETEEALATIREALDTIRDWRTRMRVETERAERAAAVTNLVTSPTEALDAVLGADSEVLNAAPAQVDSSNVIAATPAEASAAADSQAAETGEGVAVSTGTGIIGAVAPSSPSSSPSGGEGGSGGGDGGAGGGCEGEGNGDCTSCDDGNRHCSEDGGDSLDMDVVGDGDFGLQVFPFSSKDAFFLFSDWECIAMGGGSSFAMYLNKDLLHGVSEPCSTFGSCTLSSTEHFIISDLECWVFDDPSEAALV